MQQDNGSRQEREARLSGVREAMQGRGLRCLLAYDSGRHNFLRMNYVAYLSDFTSVGPHTVVALPADNDPVLFVSPRWEVARGKEQSWIEDVRPWEELGDFLRKAPRETGLVGSEMHQEVYTEIAGSLQERPANAKDVVDGVARRKSSYEMDRLGRAAEIADAGVQALHEEARVGLKEFELAAIVEYRMRSLGAMDNFGMIVASHHNQALHPPTDRVVEPGDIIIGEITPCVGGYFAQICRTMVMGPPPSALEAKFAILKKAMGLGLEAAKVGSPASAIASVINRTLSEEGYEKFCRPPYMRVRGHGLGCGSPAPGNLEDNNPTPLEEGMTFIIHPNQYLPETGYLALGDTVRIARDGARPLTRSSWDPLIKE